MVAPLANELRIHIIGAGMGGMGCALALARQGFKHIDVWESAREIGEVGAGINITPNLSRILRDLDVLEIAKAEAVAVTGASVLRIRMAILCALFSFKQTVPRIQLTGQVVHRKALQKSLVSGAMESGVVKLHLNKLVREYDFENSRFKVEARKSSRTTNGHANGLTNGHSALDGEWIQADVILAADGVKSKARTAMLARQGEVDSVVDTGQAAYRILVHRSMINEDPDLIPLFEDAHSYRWIGERRHIIAYPIQNGEIFNMSTAHPDRNFVEADTWTASGSKTEMLQVFHDFCPRVQKLLNLVPEGEVLEWKLRVHEPLTHWIDHNVALIGDACHPTLPHLAQGAAQAVEDAAVIGVVLGKLKSKADIPKALAIYEVLRKPRADWAVATAAANGKGLHLASGEAQAARDAAFKAASREGGANPDKAIDRDIQRILYAHDCAGEASERYDKLFAQMQ